MKLPVMWKLPCGVDVTISKGVGDILCITVNDSNMLKSVYRDADSGVILVSQEGARFLARKLARLFPSKRRKGKR